MEIETLKREKDSFSYKCEEERQEKVSLEEELKKCKKDCEEMKITLSKLREENMVLRGREKSSEEMCKKLLEELKRIGEKDKEMIDLRSRNFELECAKAKAEAEMEISRKRFEELDRRVLHLESDLPLLRNQEDSKSNGIEVENGNSEYERVKSDETVKVEEVSVGQSCDSPVEANGYSGNAGSGRPRCQNIVEIVDIDSDDDFAPVEIQSEGTTHPAENSHSDQIYVKSKMKKLREPVYRPDDFPLNHCSTTTISSDGNEVNKGFATPREDSMVSRQHEQKMESEQKSENLINGFPLDGLGFLEESSCSSDSDSDDDNDGVHIFFNGL